MSKELKLMMLLKDFMLWIFAPLMLVKYILESENPKGELFVAIGCIALLVFIYKKI